MSSELELQIENFEGPLDLLLSLVKEKQMDIFSIDLAELASSYLKLIDSLKETNLDLASEYLVMAATLIQLKARMLLEDPSSQKQVEEEKADLLKQLSEYQQFKKISKELREKEIKRANIFIKDISNYDNFQYEVDESKLDGKSDAIKLIMAMRKMFERTNARKLKETTIEKFNLSPAERRIELIQLLNENDSPTFDEIFSVPSINHFVVTMLTLLDMSRKQEIILHQDQQFGKITIQKGVINE